MSDLNVITIIGRVTKDVEVKFSSSGTCIVNGSIANNRRVKQGEQWVDQARFFDFVYIGKSAQATSKYLVKGKQISIKGELNQERWDKDGKQHSKVIIFVENIQLLGGGEGKHSQDNQGNSDGFQDNYPDTDIPF